MSIFLAISDASANQISPVSFPPSFPNANQCSRDELIKLSQDIHSDVTNLMRNYTEGRDKLKNSLEQSRQRQQDAANFDLSSSAYGQPNKVLFSNKKCKLYHFYKYFGINQNQLNHYCQ